MHDPTTAALSSPADPPLSEVAPVVGSPTGLGHRLPVSLPRRKIDPDALSVCRRLQDAGFDTLLVGGCVRDIILGREPKDFDVGTTATPNQVKRLFRNCRLIGRRFRLAHIVFGAKVIEVATFRGGASEGAELEYGSRDPDDRLIVRANNFGTPEEDARSRDFTVNALFYDPVAERVIDHVGGYADLRLGLVRTIGNAEDRFSEDPVRILRAIKFASRLGFTIDPETLAAIPVVAADILRCPAPRVSEEVYRLAESGHLEVATRLMHQNGVLAVILPEISAWLVAHTESYFSWLARIDTTKAAHGYLPREFVISLLYFPLAVGVVAAHGLEPGAGCGALVDTWFRPIGIRSHVPVKHRTRLRALVGMNARFQAGPPSRRKARLSTHERRVLPQALTLLRMLHAEGKPMEASYRYWRRLAREYDVPWVPVTDGAPDEPPDPDERSGRGRRRRRR